MSAENVPSTPRPVSAEKPSVPGFIREFSKEQNADERTELAQKIKAERKEHSDTKNEEAQITEELESLSKQLDAYNDSSFTSKIRDYLKMRAVKESLGMKSAEKQKLYEAVAAHDPSASAKDQIAELYEGEKKRWAKSEYTTEDISALFTEEHLASLSVEEYALLMKRFPSEMITHVTRQGIRDHTGMIYHSAGQGEFHNGFEKMIEDGRLRSPLAVSLAEAEKEGDLLKALSRSSINGEVIVPATREEALQELESKLDKYADRNAVHVAAEAVADHYYGSERGNEVFVAFPSAFVASQYHFGYRSLTGGTEEMHNDVYVWDTEEKGMNLNAGLVFIPKNTHVDPITGSRYALGPDKKPIQHESIPTISSWVASPEFSTIAETIREKIASTNRYNMPPVEEWESLAESEHAGSRGEIASALLPIKHSLESVGITNPKILTELISYQGANNFLDALRREKDESFAGVGYHINAAIERVLESAGVRYAEAKETVSSEEYWERKFQEHPEQRPSKVIYYEGTDPSQALRDWQKKNGLIKKASDGDIGFAERRKDLGSDEALTGVSRFETLMRKAIDDRFGEASE